MLPRPRTLFPLLLLSASLAIANDKDSVLPDVVLKAQTALVLVDPNTGVSVTNPTGNRIAQEDVEKALMKWGRLTPVMTTMDADLIIVVRKGTGKTVSPVITGPPANGRPVTIEPTPGDVRIGVQKGHPPDGGAIGASGDPTGPHPGLEMGPAEDMFTVYLGKPVLSKENHLSGPPLWRYIKKNALRSPDVPAVDEFRKLIEKAEKQRKGKP